VKRRALFACASLAALSASAQPVGMEQIVRRPAELSGIEQVPAGAAERASPKAGSAEASQAPDAAAPSLLLALPKRPVRSSVDADEIARLLGNGQATSIDAAAALALESVEATRKPPAEDPKPEDVGALSGRISAHREKP